MKEQTRERLWQAVAALLIALVLMLIVPPVLADDITVGGGTDSSDDENLININRGGDSEGGDAEAKALANSEGGAGGTGGGATVHTNSESNSIVLSGARDSAACFTKMGIGAEGFGLFWSRSDPFCKKVRLIARKIEEGNFAAAARLECTLNEWKEVYGHKNVSDSGYKQCLDDLMPAEPVGMYITSDEYDLLIMAQVTKEEYTEQTELVEYRMTQQQNLIDSLQQEAESDDAEIERLKLKSAKEEARRAAARKALEKEDE